MADLKVMGFMTTGHTTDIAMLFQIFFKLHFPEKRPIHGLNKGWLQDCSGDMFEEYATLPHKLPQMRICPHRRDLWGLKMSITLMHHSNLGVAEGKSYLPFKKSIVLF